MREKISVNLLSSCTEKELIKLEHFLECKAYNSDKNIISLYKALKNIINKKLNFDDEAEVEIYNKVFPNDKNKSKDSLGKKQKSRLNILLSELTRLTEQFLSFEALEENSHFKVDLLNGKLLANSQFLLYSRHFNKRTKEKNNIEKKGLEYYKLAKIIEEKHLNYLYQTGEIYTNDNLNQLNEYLDVEYLLEKLSYYTTELSIEEATNKTFNSNTFGIIDYFLNIEEYSKIPILIIYKAHIELVKNKSVENYYQLLELLNKYDEQLKYEDVQHFYVSATNFCTRQIKKGIFGYNQLYDLYETMHNKNYMLENNIMPLVKLKNIVTAGCRVNDFEWASEMISKYIPFVQKKVSDLVFRYFLGVIAFYKKDYKEAINHFVYGDGINLSYDINNRTMIMKSHYEIDKEYDERTLQIYRSTEKYFITNKHLSKTDISAYKNFIRSLINLYRIKFRSTKMTLDSLKTKIEKQELNSDRKWLQDKIAELN